MSWGVASIWFGALLLTACRVTHDAPSASSAVSGTPSVEANSLCGPLECREFTTSIDALGVVLALRPAVIAFGESHALRGAADVLTATERFGDEFLPLLRTNGAATLVVELINPPAGCETEKAAVAAVQKPIVERQDAGNQDRFVTLGHRARALSMVPLILEPTCAEFVPVRQAGPDGVAALLELIAAQTRGKLERLAAHAKPGEVVLAYGGGIHNDIAAPGETKPFAFGESLSQTTEGRYVAVDLIVPEFVGDTEVWRALPWYEYWTRLSQRGVTLIQTKPNEYTLILERDRRRTAPAASGAAASSTALAPNVAPNPNAAAVPSATAPSTAP